MFFDLPPPPPPIWLPPKPAIIRPMGELNRHARRAIGSKLGAKTPLLMSAVPGTAFVVDRTAPAITISNTANASSNTAGTSFTFSSLAIGAAASNRIIVVAVSCPFANTAWAASNQITIGGVTAAFVNQAGVSGSQTAFGILAVASGTTATIVLNFSASQARAGVSVYRLDNVQSLTPIDANQTSSSATGFTLNAARGGVIIGTAAISNNTTDRRCAMAHAAMATANGAFAVAVTAAGVWTGLTSDYNNNIGTASTATITGLNAISLR